MSFTYVDWSSVNTESLVYIPPYVHSTTVPLPSATSVGDMLIVSLAPGSYSPATGTGADARLSSTSVSSGYGPVEIGAYGVATDLTDIPYETNGVNPHQMMVVAINDIGTGTIGWGRGYASGTSAEHVPVDYTQSNMICFVRDQTYTGLPTNPEPHIGDSDTWTTIGEISISNHGLVGYVTKGFYYNGPGPLPSLDVTFSHPSTTVVRDWLFFVVLSAIVPPSTPSAITPLRMSNRNDGWGYTQPHARLQVNNDQSGASSTSNRVFGVGSNAYDPPETPTIGG